VRTPGSGGQNGWTFLHKHGGESWACDFLQVSDLFFRSLFAFFLIELKSRKVIHVGVTRSPPDARDRTTPAGGDCVWTNATVPPW